MGICELPKKIISLLVLFIFVVAFSQMLYGWWQIFNNIWSNPVYSSGSSKFNGVVLKLLLPPSSIMPGWKGILYLFDDKSIVEPSLFISSLTNLLVGLSCLLISLCLFLIIIVGDNSLSSLLYPLNLIDWPNRDCNNLSPSFNFNLWKNSGVK